MSKITISGSTERVFTHDAAGNIATDTRSGALYAYDYNARNRLETVTVASTLRGTYTYNGLEQLSSRVLTNMSPSGTTHFIHDRRGNVIAETGGSGPSSTDREYIWLPEAEIAPAFNSRAQIDRPLAVVDQVSTSPSSRDSCFKRKHPSGSRSWRCERVCRMDCSSRESTARSPTATYSPQRVHQKTILPPSVNQALSAHDAVWSVDRKCAHIVANARRGQEFRSSPAVAARKDDLDAHLLRQSDFARFSVLVISARGRSAVCSRKIVACDWPVLQQGSVAWRCKVRRLIAWIATAAY